MDVVSEGAGLRWVWPVHHSHAWPARRHSPSGYTLRPSVPRQRRKKNMHYGGEAPTGHNRSAPPAPAIIDAVDLALLHGCERGVCQR